MSLFSRTDKSLIGQWWWTVDRGMLSAFMVLSLIGVALVATGSPSVAERIGYGYYHFFVRHMIILGPALLLLLGTSMLSHKFIRRLAALLFVGSLLTMLMVLGVGNDIKGARRWVHVLGFSLQPSEFIKPSFAIMAAWMMSLQKEKSNFKGNAITAGFYLLTVTLLILQPDFGMTFLVTSIWAAQIFLAGFPFRLLVLLLIVGILGVFMAYQGLDHVHSRIDRYLDPASGDSYQIDKSLEAFQNGGIIGTGPGQGTVKMSLPDAHADFIFSVAGEEMGMLFVFFIISIYGLILLRGYNRLMDSDDMFVVLAAGGLLTVFGLQAAVHMGSALHLFPTKGMTLPFVSYGGSSLLSMGITAGAILGLTRNKARSGLSRGGLSLQTNRAHRTARRGVNTSPGV
ncbi:MAG: cell division protein FtsW [Alphaproteobacteria bacterium]|nr:cell division protein FtsW [Alphaproteobacteria bacterium]